MDVSRIDHGKRLGVLLRRAEMTMEELATASGVDVDALRRLRANDSEGFSFDALGRIINVLTPKVASGIVGDYLLGLGIDRLHKTPTPS